MKVAGTIGMRVAELEAKVEQHSALISQRPEKGDTGAAARCVKRCSYSKAMYAATMNS